MKKEDLNFEPFYYVEPMKIIDDPLLSSNEFFKYENEKSEIEHFLKNCSLKDFIWVIISIFKNKFANGALLGTLISETIQKNKNKGGTLFIKKMIFRNDLKSLKFHYTNDDFFDFLEFEFVNPYFQINNIITEVLNGKQYSKNGNKYILSSGSGIDYLDITSTFFKLKSNKKNAKKFH